MDRIVVDVQSGDVSIVPLTADEIAELAKPEPPEQIRNRRIGELKALLAASDYKAMPDYDKPDPAILAQRQAWREEIRQLEGS
jgi:hypothetical protein